MKLLTSTAIALAIVAASASSAFAHDNGSVSFGIGYNSAPIGYSSSYSLGYSNHPRVIYEPTVVYYAQPTRYYQPVVVQTLRGGYYGDSRYSYGYRDRGYRDHDDRDWGHGEHRGWGHGHHDRD